HGVGAAAPVAGLGEALEDRVAAADQLEALAAARVGGRGVHGAGVQLRVAGGRVDGKVVDVVGAVAGAADAALEVAGGAGLGVVHRPQTVAVGQRVVGRPLVLEQFAAGLAGGGAGPRPPEHRQARRDEPEDGAPDGQQQAAADEAALAV